VLRRHREPRVVEPIRRESSSQKNASHRAKKTRVIGSIKKAARNRSRFLDINKVGENKVQHRFIRISPIAVKTYLGRLTSAKNVRGHHRENLLAWTNGSSKSRVIGSVTVVPQRLAQFNALTQNFDLCFRASWRIGWHKVLAAFREKIFIVAISQNGFKNVPDLLLV
jgi:hypothetical protein